MSLQFHSVFVSELEEKRLSEAAIGSAGPTSPTVDGYTKMLIDLYRKIADAGNDYSTLSGFGGKELAELLRFDYLENVQSELGLSDASKRLEYMQAKHLKITSLLLELTKLDPDSSSDQLESHLTELRSCITTLWNTMQFSIHWKNSGKNSLAP